METPALAYPITLETIFAPAVTWDVNTINNLSSLEIAMANPVVVPWDIVPTATTPVRVGAKVTIAPAIGEKTLLVEAALYNCAFTVMVVPTKLTVAVLLKNADKEVMVPLLGDDHEKLTVGPNADPLISIVPATIVALEE